MKPDQDFYGQLRHQQIHPGVILTTRVRLARNVEGYPFPNHMNAQGAQACYGEVQAAFYSANSQMKARFKAYPLEQQSRQQLASWVERRILSPEAYAHPEGAVLLMDEAQQQTILLGEEDHIRIQAIQPGYAPLHAYDAAEALARVLEERLRLSYDPQWGFFTACPSNVGTGMRLSYLVLLPALALHGEAKSWFEHLRQQGLTVRGSHGEGGAEDGVLYQLSNRKTLGLSERDTFEEVNRGLEALVEAETQSRIQYWQTQPGDFSDRVARAYGLLRYAHYLGEREAVQNLALLVMAQTASPLLPHLQGVNWTDWMMRLGQQTLLPEAQRLDPHGALDPDALVDRYRAHWIRQELIRLEATLEAPLQI